MVSSDFTANESSSARTAKKRAIQIALFSLLPGLGQLLNKRVDKAIAFFLVDLINITVLCFAFGAFNSSIHDIGAFGRYLQIWQFGSLPSAILLSLIAAFTLYAMIDAYKDGLLDQQAAPSDPSDTTATTFALNLISQERAENGGRWRKPLLSLSLATSFSYFTHLGTILLSCYLVLFKVFPIDPVEKEHAIEFVLTDLASAQASNQSVGQIQSDGAPDYTKQKSHSPEKLGERIQGVKPSDAGSRVDDKHKEAASKETDKIASKQIITPDQRQSPVEAISYGAARNVQERTRTPDQIQHEQISRSARPDKDQTKTSAQEVLPQSPTASLANTASDPSSQSTLGRNHTESQNALSSNSVATAPSARGGSANNIDKTKLSSSDGPSSRLYPDQGAALPIANFIQTSSNSNALKNTAAASNTMFGSGQTAVSIAMLTPQQYQAKRSTPSSPDAKEGHVYFDGTIGNEIAEDRALKVNWHRYFSEFQRHAVDEQSDFSAGRAEAELVFNSEGAPVSYNITKEEGIASESLSKIIDHMDFSKLPTLPAHHRGNIVVKMGILNSGSRSVATFDMDLIQSKKIGPNTASPKFQNKIVNSSAKPPSMLGFMDEKMCKDPKMQYFWSEYSKLISGLIKNRKTPFASGMTMASFAIDRSGRPTEIQLSDPQSDISRQLEKELKTLASANQKLPSLPANQAGKTFMAVKFANVDENPFVSVEIQTNPINIDQDSLNSFESETKLQAYLEDIKKLIYKSWNPPSKQGAKPVMIGFQVSSNGRISNHKVIQSSGDQQTDMASLNAALTVSNWVAPPAGTEDNLDVSMVIQNCGACDEASQAENASKKHLVRVQDANQNAPVLFDGVPRAQVVPLEKKTFPLTY